MRLQNWTNPEQINRKRYFKTRPDSEIPLLIYVMPSTPICGILPLPNQTPFLADNCLLNIPVSDQFNALLLKPLANFGVTQHLDLFFQ
jgi:hypothetical protein